MTDDVRQDYFRIEHEVDESTARLPAVHSGPRSDYPIYDIGDGIGFQPVWGGNLLLNWVHFAAATGSCPTTSIRRSSWAPSSRARWS